ncbi:MAG: protoheme IX farnesyltransferase [Elusimicrobia bacterium]|nr:protoheme IX farnesyltransferase [Elusimicrobiota bacterium]
MKDCLSLAKPRITLLVALCAAAGFALASRGRLDRAKLGWTALGVALAAASTGCLNQVLEAKSDALMNRTRGRPIPAGRVRPGTALLLGTAWGAAGLALLAWKAGATACGLTAFTLASYLAVYTPMKRVSPLSTWIGAIPGALPPVIGWAAAGRALDADAAALFAIQFLWQMPHFLALARLYQEDYARGGLRVYGAVDPSGTRTSRQLVSTSGLLLTASVAPYALGLAGATYLACALACGAAFFLTCLSTVRVLDERAARRVFVASLAYLPLVLSALVLNRSR